MPNTPYDDTPHVATSATSATPDKGPEPLWNRNFEMKEYPLAALGVLEEAVRAIAELSNAHKATCANSVLAVAGLAVQGLANVEFPNKSSIPTSLFFLTIAESGDGKTACDGFAAWPIKKREEEMKAEYVRKKEENKKSAPRIPAILTCSEATYEGFYKLLQVGHPSLGIFSDEGGQFTGGYSMRETRESILSNLSALWGGKDLQRVRALEVPSVLTGKRASLHLMLQPVIAEKLTNDTTTKGQGFLARCLIAYPPSMAGERLFKKPTQRALQARDEYNERILKILRMSLTIKNPGRSLHPRLLKLLPEEEARWIAFQNEMEPLRAEEERYHLIREFAAKIGEHALRIAAVLTLVEDPQAIAINRKALENAFVIVRFYTDETLRLAQNEIIPQEIKDAHKILKWLKRRYQEKEVTTFTIRDVENSGPTSLRSNSNKFQSLAKARDAIEKALAVLVEKRWVIAPTKKGDPYSLYSA